MARKNNAEMLSSAIVGREIGVDFGTQNTVIYISGKGIAVNEPSLIAIDTRTQDVVAVGTDAKNMLGRNPNSIKIVNPIENGVIADFDFAAAMLKAFLKRALKISSFSKSQFIFSHPYGATEVEKSALYQIGSHLGAHEVSLISAPVAIVLGEGFDIETPQARMIIDMGSGHTEVSVSSFGEVIANHFEREGGNYIDECLVRYMKIKHNLSISMIMASNIKEQIASAYPIDNDFMDVRGRDIIENIPRSITVHSDEIRNTICDSLRGTVRAIAKVCENLSPQISADILENEVIVTGKAAFLTGFKEYVENTLGIKIMISQKPKIAIAKGIGKIFENRG